MAGLKRQLENPIKTFYIIDINDSEKKEMVGARGFEPYALFKNLFILSKLLRILKHHETSMKLYSLRFASKI